MKVAGEAISVHLHIMILLVGSFEELDQEVKLVKAVVTACLEKDPFETEGVGELVRLTVEHGCAMRPMIELCIFGDHAATPNADTG
ncbi:hypothetical protein PF002_g21349 [Phytophthora fragariae]|uniref:Uncharacterized protein n=2 Tax=Phytophthora fragariae TaxID=53985 RepID=A0A6A3TJY7_9STRA|nr:hypothetical protein PF003_g2564 [Phytophthora fragariae]KAE8928821.1 hypothetical protein PF009_g21052 [Phytophthora fragariae]KAE9138627.1 hypothetical protein PF006_g13911 [Phytophthora fragariae]KAE9192186.1 hypothetical protein PF004_g21385 [Phytophthora fragariae]KAE9202068.1 hypothetical protein PF002_g21349 [Phytophthora fragariae]